MDVDYQSCGMSVRNERRGLFKAVKQPLTTTTTKLTNWNWHNW